MARSGVVATLLWLLGSVPGATPFKYFSYESLAEHLHALESRYPDLVRVSSVQRAYDLPSPGTCGRAQCQQWFATVTHRPSLRPPNEGPDPRPEVFFSGELHGNERIGPTATVELAKLLVTMADCVERGLEEGLLLCSDLSASDREMLSAGAGPDEAALVERAHWMYRLVRTRVVVVMPAANALGYHRNTRTEGRVDPNRDFPYNQAATSCMQTITARAVNELFRDHMFQLALTFHGGMQAIAYEWGAPNHPGGRQHKDISPDDNVQAQVAHRMSSYGGKGSFSGGRAYPAKPMNSLVYPVHGGMEDWAYAASWDPKMVTPCRAKGYDRSRTMYDPAQLRVLNILIETSDSKVPRESSLGSSRAVFDPKATDARGNGHLPRNLRLMLLVADVVQPYVRWTVASPLTALRPTPTAWANVPGGWLWQGTHALEQGSAAAALSWRVGGAVHVDATQLGWGCVPQAPHPGSLSPGLPRTSGSSSERGSLRGSTDGGTGTRTSGEGSITSTTSSSSSSSVFDPEDCREVPFAAAVRQWSAAQQGGARWKEEVGSGADHSTVFSASVALPSAACAAGEVPFAMARAQVDQSWAEHPSNSQPSAVPPQSHAANARTNSAWHHENAGHVIQGRRWWYSPPMWLVQS